MSDGCRRAWARKVGRVLPLLLQLSAQRVAGAIPAARLGVVFTRPGSVVRLRLGQRWHDGERGAVGLVATHAVLARPRERGLFVHHHDPFSQRVAGSLHQPADDRDSVDY
jgi:hypothetical protein